MCSVAILSDDPTVFADIPAEPCTLVNPYVAQELHLGFYAGQALRSPNGMPLGSLCIIDRRARRLTPAESELLVHLALVAQDLLALQAAKVAESPLMPALRARQDELVQQCLTRLSTLAELRALDPTADADDLERYQSSRLDEAKYLAQSLHRELQATLAILRRSSATGPARGV
jgi:hypothetical protein